MFEQITDKDPEPGALLAPRAYARPLVSFFKKIREEKKKKKGKEKKKEEGGEGDEDGDELEHVGLRFGAKRFALREYQLEGVNWLLFNWYASLSLSVSLSLSLSP